jgi:hypothetical protein
MNSTPFATSFSTRFTALCAAVTMTTLLGASQLGLAEHYTGKADAAMAKAAPAASQSAKVASKLAVKAGLPG